MTSKSPQPFELTHLEFKAIELELARPLVTALKTITRREIIALRATIQIGEASVIGFGEVAPLPGWSAETVEECLASLKTIATPMRFNSIEQLNALLPDIGRSPNLRFGVELALLDALARHQQTTLAQLIRAQFNPGDTTELTPVIPLQSTVGALALDALLAHARQAQDKGYAYLKLKVGVGSIEEDIAKLAAICAACPDLKIRLDANGAWSIAEALGITHAIARDFPDGAVDLIEQPVSPDDFEEFLTQFGAQKAQRGASSKLAIAADESADSFERVARLIEHDAMRAVVLKPSTLGGLLPCAALIAKAQAKGLRVVLSNLILSAIGRRGVAQLAAAFPELTGPHGLATGGWFRQDLAPDADRIEDATLILRRAAGLGFEPNVTFASYKGAP